MKDKELVEHLVSEIKDKLNELKLQLAGMKERLMWNLKVNIEDILGQPRATELPQEELGKSGPYEEAAGKSRRSEPDGCGSLQRNEEAV